MPFVKRSHLLAAAIMLPALAHAQQSPSADEMVIVVPTPHSESPLIVKTNPKAPRQPVPAHDGADYLKSIPGFSVIRKGGTDGDPVFRGMAGSRLSILVDGQTILGGCGGRMDPPTAYVFPAAYDRITVLKGPQTVLYGPGNSAGTVLFEHRPRRAEQSVTSGNGSLMLGSFGRNDEMAEARTGSPDYYLVANGTRSQMRDYKDGNGTSIHSSYLRWSANAALGWTPNDDARIELSAAKSDGRAAYADRAMDGAKFARDNVALSLERTHLSALVSKAQAQLYYNYVDHVMDNYSLRPFVASAMMPAPAASNPDRTTIGGRASLELELADTTQSTLGVDFQNNRHTSRDAWNQAAQPYQAMARTQDAQFRNTGIFGEIRQRLSDASRMIGGLRLDTWHAEDKRANVMAGMAMVANPTANQSRNEMLSSGFARYEHDLANSGAAWYAGIGRSVRAPDYWELISKESAASVSAFNTRPEKNTQLDVGFNYRNEGWSGTVSAFYSKVADFILIQSNVDKGTMMMPRLTAIARNINATTWGMEAGLVYQLADNWKLDSALSYVQGRNDTDGVALGQMPPLEGRIGIGYDNKTWSLGALLRGVAAQNRYTANQGNIAGQDIGRTAGFSIFSVNGGWRHSRNIQLTAGVDNIFNKTYAEHLSRAGSMVQGFTTTARVNEPGRNIWIKANFAID